jgi:hypothetical protein
MLIIMTCSSLIVMSITKQVVIFFYANNANKHLCTFSLHLDLWEYAYLHVVPNNWIVDSVPLC